MLLFCWIISFLSGDKTTAATSENVSINVLCNLPMLGPSGYISDDGLVFFWNLCPSNKVKLSDLNTECGKASGNEIELGGVCVTKVWLMVILLFAINNISNDFLSI